MCLGELDDVHLNEVAKALLGLVQLGLHLVRNY